MSDAKHLLVHSFIFVGPSFSSGRSAYHRVKSLFTVKILKFGTPQTIALIVLKIEKNDVTLH